MAQLEEVEVSTTSKKTMIFPSEVLTEILLDFVTPPSQEPPTLLPFRQISILQAQLAAFALVNRSWNLVATALLYRHIRVRGDDNRLHLASSPDRRRLVRSLSSFEPITWTWRKRPCIFPSLNHLNNLVVSDWGSNSDVDLRLACPVLEHLSLTLPPHVWAPTDRDTLLTLPPTLTWLHINAGPLSYSPTITSEAHPLLQYLAVVWTELREDHEHFDPLSSFGPFLARLAPCPEVLHLTFLDQNEKPRSLAERQPSSLDKSWTRLRELHVEGVDLVDLMETVELPALEILSVKSSSRSETTEVVRVVEEGLNRSRLPKLDRLKLASERFDILNPSLSLETTPRWTSLLEVGVTVVDRTDSSISDIQQRVRLRSRATRLPEELYFIIISLNSLFPDTPRLPFKFDPWMKPDSPSYDEFVGAIKARSAFLAAASLVCHQWNAIASPLLYGHLLPVHPTTMSYQLYGHRNLLDRIRRISTQQHPEFSTLLLEAYPPFVFPSLLHLDTLRVTGSELEDLQQPLSTTFPHLQTLTISIPSSNPAAISFGHPLVLPPSLVSLSIHVDWDWECDFLASNLPHLTSLSLHIFLGFSDEGHPSLDDFIDPSTALQLETLRISLTGLETDARYDFEPNLLVKTPNLRSLSLNGTSVRDILSEPTTTTAAASELEGIEIWQVPLFGQEATQVSFGWDFEWVDLEEMEEDPYFDAEYSIPASLYHLLDRTRLPSLRTLAVASLDFKREEHRMGTLVARHGFEMGKMGIKMVDRWGIGFGEVREGWEWGKVVERTKTSVDGVEEGEEGGGGALG